MTSSRSAKQWIGLMVVLQAFTVLCVWGAGPAATPALADGIPDAGAQQQHIIDQLKAVNERLDRLTALLADGKLQVTVRKTDDASPNR